MSEVRATCVRLFGYRRQQTWPPPIVVGEGWGSLYAAAVEDVDVLRDVDAAVRWADDFVPQIAENGEVGTGSNAVD